MALVAYDNSDSSECEDDENDNTPAIILNQKVNVPPTNETNSEHIASEPMVNKHELGSESDNLFNLLPQPSTKKPAVIEEDDEFLHKKESAPNIVKPKAKISVPSLSDFKDVDNRPMISKPKCSNGKKSGLLSLLPQPRNAVVSTKTTSMVPHVLTKKPAALVPTSVKKDTLPSPMKKVKTETKSLINYSDESDNEEETTDFFSINKKVELPPVEDVPLDTDMEKKEEPIDERQGIERYFKKDIPQKVELPSDGVQEDYMSSSYNSYYNGMEVETGSNTYTEPTSSSSNNAVLDEEALRHLVGSRSKRKKEDIQIVDVNQQEVLADAREWLLKGLMDDTSKRQSASKKRGNEPTNQQKRKHQITYLAHQAKAQEAELQNQWANNRMSKRQTQSKYGF